MKIVVLNGSPKGNKSVTMQYVGYMQKKHPEHEFKIINIAQEINQIEKEPNRFSGIISEVSSADGVLWAFPLYVCVVHSNYMRFIELISEHGADAFAGKYAAALSTSIHFFDHTAHNYVHAICDDLGMKYIGFFSASMDEIFTEAGRQKLEYFTSSLLAHINNGLPTQRLYEPVEANIARYMPGPDGRKAENSAKKVLLITDATDDNGNLAKMVGRIARAFVAPIEVIRLAEINMVGGCLGCLKCGLNNECVYSDRDDIRDIYTVKIQNADIIILAGELKGRFLSSRFKMFIDRRFLGTHQPQMTSKQVAYLLSGPLSRNFNVYEILTALAELDRANLAGIITDEAIDSAGLDALLDNLAGRLVDMSTAGYVMPPTYLAVGGRKIFRDEIYGRLRFVFQGDHRYYKKHGMYDFPQKQLSARVQNAIMIPLTKLPPFRNYMQAEMTDLMLREYKKVINPEA